MQSRSCQDTFSVRWVGGEVAIKTTSAKVEVEVEAELGNSNNQTTWFCRFVVIILIKGDSK